MAAPWNRALREGGVSDLCANRACYNRAFTMKLSPQQDRALCKAAGWLRVRDKQTFLMLGYAGTGKTTLAKYFAESVSGLTLYAAYTGKAADVMRCEGAISAIAEPAGLSARSVAPLAVAARGENLGHKRRECHREHPPSAAGRD
jgi:AAA domain